MALTVANVGRGNYVLGGLGRVEGPSAAEAMDLAQREEQRFRDAQRQARQTELNMQRTRQQMALAQSQEARAQQQFEAQQAARGQAAARAAQERAAMSTLMEGLSGIGGAPAGGVSGAAPVAPVAAPRAGLALPTGPSVPLSFGTPAPAPVAPAAGTPLSMGITPAGPAGGVQVASLDPREAFRAAFQARPDLFGTGVQVAGGGGVDALVGGAGGAPIRTGQTTAAGRPVFQDPATGELYSERTETFRAPNGAFYNVPMVNATGGQISPEELDAILSMPRPVDPVTGEPLTPYNSVEEAVAGASARSDGLLPAEQPLFPQAPNEFVLTQIDMPNVIPGVGMINYVQYNPATGEIRGPNGQPIDPVIQGQMRESASFNYADSVENTAAVAQSRLEQARAAVDQAAAAGDQNAYARALDDFRAAEATALAAQAALPNATAALRTTQPITSRGIFSEEGPGAAGLPPLVNEQVTAASGAEPASPEAAAAEAPTTAEEAAPTTQPAYGGLQLNFGTPVQLSFGEVGAEGEASSLYVAAPERIFQEAEVVARQSQRLQLLANYYRQTGNLQGLVGVMNQLDELTVEQRYLDGMTAIVGIQQENFGPVQALLQQRFPGRQVEVRPYTDGTVEIFLDGQSEARLTWDAMAQNLRGVYDRGFIEQQQALAEEAASRSRFLFEQETQQMLQGAREIAVANNQGEIDRLEGSGRIARIGETANGEVVFETVVNGLPIQFVYRETMTRDPATGKDITRLVATPVGRTALER